MDEDLETLRRVIAALRETAEYPDWREDHGKWVHDSTVAPPLRALADAGDAALERLRSRREVHDGR